MKTQLAALSFIAITGCSSPSTTSYVEEVDAPEVVDRPAADAGGEPAAANPGPENVPAPEPVDAGALGTAPKDAGGVTFQCTTNEIESNDTPSFPNIAPKVSVVCGTLASGTDVEFLRIDESKKVRVAFRAEGDARLVLRHGASQQTARSGATLNVTVSTAVRFAFEIRSPSERVQKWSLGITAE